MSTLDFEIPVVYQHRIRFTRNAFCRENLILANLLKNGTQAGQTKALVFIENEIVKCFPTIEDEIWGYFGHLDQVELTAIARAEGGEYCKRNEMVCREVMDAIEENKIDRHSYVIVIGGGAFLDVVGFAAATAHRGIRLVRFPTTTLAQDDSGVGVKNGINLYKKKNFLGSFAVPYGVVNDFTFLYTQPEKICRDGLVEAVKVALVKDGDFFQWIEAHLDTLYMLQPDVLEECVQRSATLHAQHISLGGDPFELGSSRPLDYGHWSAHKVEQISDFRLSHAEAVAIGVALDSVYAWKMGYLSEAKAMRVLKVLEGLGMAVWDDDYESKSASGDYAVLDGLEEFREHLGGALTVLLLSDLGEGFDVHEIDSSVMIECFVFLKERSNVQKIAMS